MSLAASLSSLAASLSPMLFLLIPQSLSLSLSLSKTHSRPPTRSRNSGHLLRASTGGGELEEAKEVVAGLVRREVPPSSVV